MNPFLTLNPDAVRTATAIIARLFPADDDHPGASEIGVVTYVDRALASAYRADEEMYRLGLAAFDRCAHNAYSQPFADCTAPQQDTLITQLEQGVLPDFHIPPQQRFFALLRAHLQEGLFADPLYGGNREKLGWQVLGHPGVWLENSAEENLTSAPVTKGGVIQSLADIDLSAGRRGFSQRQAQPLPGYDPQAGAKAPTDEVDVILVGLGAMGGMIAPILTAVDKSS